MDSKKILLIVDDDEMACEELQNLLSDVENTKIVLAYTGSEAQKVIEREELALALLDYKLPDTTGIKLLKLIKAGNIEIPVIIITGVGSIESGVEAIKEGAHDYILKPFRPEKIRALVKNLLAYQKLREENIALREELGIKYSLNQPIGKSVKIRRIYDLLPELAQTEATILIRGESGTGKELLAKSIHYNSPRRDKPFIIADCTALSESLLESELFGHEKGAFTGAIKRKTGRFEQADEGSIFLDEIGAFSPASQHKLLRVLQERTLERVGGEETITVDVRIIVATNQNLEEMVKAGSFREDLYYRINVISIDLPPLREREEDIPLLAHYFLELFSRKNKKEIKGIDNDVYRLLIDYEWPGNIRELENTMERAVVIVRGNMIRREDLPATLQKADEDSPAGGNSLREHEKSLIIKVLTEKNYNISQTARKLGITRSTLYGKMKKLGITGK